MSRTQWNPARAESAGPAVAAVFGRRAMLWLAAGVAVSWTGCAPSTATGGVPSSLPPSPTAPVPTISQTPAPPSASVTTSTDPGLPYTTDPVTVAGSGSGYHVQAVRVGRHEGYERIVMELSRGTGQPPLDARYVELFQTQGEGSPVRLPGTARLLVTIRGLVMPGPSDTVIRGNQSLSTSAIAGLYVDPWFEGQAQLMVGLDRVRPYRLFVLSAPTRVVLDVSV